jgi:hypothetical protein
VAFLTSIGLTRIGLYPRVDFEKIFCNEKLDIETGIRTRARRAELPPSSRIPPVLEST